MKEGNRVRPRQRISIGEKERWPSKVHIETVRAVMKKFRPRPSRSPSR
jgi:hypothetical protein